MTAARVIVFANVSGAEQLLPLLPEKSLIGLVAASIRPGGHERLRKLAEERGATFLLQPRRTDAEYPQFVRDFQALKPDLIWTHAYPMLLHPELLQTPTRGAVNIHGAPLPRYRGANPIQWALLNNERDFGVTLHEMAPGFDEGAIIDQRFFPIRFDDTWIEVNERIMKGAESLIRDNLDALLAGTWAGVPQDEAQASYFSRRRPEDGQLTADMSVLQIYNLIRALVAPHPGVRNPYAEDDGSMIDTWLSPAECAALKYSLPDVHALSLGELRLHPAQSGPPASDWKRIPIQIRRKGEAGALATAELRIECDASERYAGRLACSLQDNNLSAEEFESAQSLLREFTSREFDAEIEIPTYRT